MKLFTVLLLTMSLFSACVAQRGESTANRKVSDFTSLNVSGGFGTSTLEQGTPGVKIITDESNLKYIITENEGDELNIYFSKDAPRNIRASLVITFSSLKEINNSGSTNFESQSTIKSKRMTFNFSGSGNFMGGVDVEYLEVNISGSSDFKLNGYAQLQEYTISGSGNIMANALKGKQAEVAISGSGNVDLNVESVQTSTSGSGRVRNSN